MIIYQYHCGRDVNFNLSEHQGQVFHRLAEEYDWQQLQQTGFDAVYLLGVWDYQSPILVSTYREVEPLASCFAISKLTTPDERLGTQADWLDLVTRIKATRLKVFVDFVPNQTATNHPWVSEHPDYYLHEGDRIKSGFSGDVNLLDYGNPQLRQQMIEVLKTIASYQIDGVRCDMAHLVPNDFWQQAISEVRHEYPDFIFLAEAYSDSVFNWQPITSLIQSGFDLIYHEFLYRNLKQGVENHNLSGWIDHINYVLNQPIQAKLMNYWQNHDDPLIKDMTPNLEPLTVLGIFLPDSLLVYNGQMRGVTQKINLHDQTWIKTEVEANYQWPRWFKNALMIKRALKPMLTRVELSEREVFTAKMNFNHNQAMLVGNLSNFEVKVTERLGNGLIHGLTEEETLKPGTAEFFLLK